MLIDGEAGIEQFNRRVMKNVDHLIVVSNSSAKGLSVAHTIAHVTDKNRAVDFQSMGLVLNRVRSESEANDIRERTRLEVYGYLLEDYLIREFDFKGQKLTQIPDTSPSLHAVRCILTRLGTNP